MSAWGKSWGAAFGVAFGLIGAPVPTDVPPQTGGGAVVSADQSANEVLHLQAMEEDIILVSLLQTIVEEL